MSQMFKPGTNSVARLSLVVAVLLLVILGTFLLVRARSPYIRDQVVGIAVGQPVRFSHELHSKLNISCRYCHGAAEQSAYAGIPDTHTCMSCHSQIATYSELLASVRESYATGEYLVWNQVHNLADHVYFDHSSHVNQGVACETCHGQVPEMPLIWQAEVMTMNWCMECHTKPEEYLRPQSEVYTFGYETPENQTEIGLELIELHDIDVSRLNNCGVCHR